MDERPKEFDDRITAYLPGLRALAKRISSEPDELVSDTLIYAFKNWKSFRPDGAFWAWISLNMRSISQQRAKRNRLHTYRVDLAMLVPTRTAGACRRSAEGPPKAESPGRTLPTSTRQRRDLSRDRRRHWREL